MNETVDIRRLAALLKAKRGRRGLREVAAEIGDVSASTLSRVELGKVPDLDTFVRICQWLSVPPDQFFPARAQQEAGAEAQAVRGMSTPEIITAHLRADRELAPETADALATMIRLAYNAVANGELRK
jgi:transcriptional regulator with XRE-family HTH domain